MALVLMSLVMPPPRCHSFRDGVKAMWVFEKDLRPLVGIGFALFWLSGNVR